MEWPEKEGPVPEALKMSLVKYRERRWHYSVMRRREEGTNWTRISEEESRTVGLG